MFNTTPSIFKNWEGGVVEGEGETDTIRAWGGVVGFGENFCEALVVNKEISFQGRRGKEKEEEEGEGEEEEEEKKGGEDKEEEKKEEEIVGKEKKGGEGGAEGEAEERK